MLALILSMTACGGEKKDPIVGEGTPYDSFFKAMDTIRGYGDQTQDAGTYYLSVYYYANAGAGVSSFRYAIETILWLKGEGETLDALAADSPYTGWNEIAAIGFNSPYPYYFEGLVSEIQGMVEQAGNLYANAAIMTLFPEEGLDFFYLKNMEVEALYELRDTARTLEEKIYARYTPETFDYPRDFATFDDAYMRICAQDSLSREDYRTAYTEARIALQNNPLDVNNFRAAALCAGFAGDLPAAGRMVDEGLLLFPEDEGLTAVYNTIMAMGGEGQ